MPDEAMLAIWVLPANLAADFHAPDDSPRFPCPQSGLIIGDPAVGGHLTIFAGSHVDA